MDLELSDVFDGIFVDDLSEPVLTPRTTADGDDPMLSEHPELSLEKLREYIEADDVIRFDPFERTPPKSVARLSTCSREMNRIRGTRMDLHRRRQ